MTEMSSQEVDLGVINMIGHMTTVNTLLAEVPALSVGLLGFAVMTFFMVLKKVKLPPFLLLSSVLFTFFAAIVDVARISLHNDNSFLVQKEVGDVTHALAEAREALSSIASGLRFLYFWAFVSQAPLCEQGSATLIRLHSGSWLHWGPTGFALRWSTLVASVSIFILQTLWRLVQSLHKFGPVYDVESAFEIAASGIFIVKLILNAVIVEKPCQRQTLWQYSMAFSALLINMGLGIGNLRDFAFSETPLGRLLLATELYILIVSSMVFTFYRRKSTQTPLPLRKKRASSFCGLHVSKFDAEIGLAGEDDANPAGSSQSAGLRALSWLTWNGNATSQFRPSIEDGKRPRSEEAAERGVTLSPSEKNAPFAVPDDIQRFSVNSSTTDPITRGISEGFSSSTTQLPTDSVYENGKPSPTAASRTASPDSPTLGFDGSQKPKQPSIRSFTSSRQSGYESLLREQDQLERSIAALKMMFEQGSSGEGRRNESRDTAIQPSGGSRIRESSTTAYGPTSASNRSDFSLSVFPEPPEVEVTENLRRIRPLSSSASALTPTQMSFDVGGQSFPVSTTGIDDAAVLSLESAGPHYDVTSFIGGLTSPEQHSTTQTAMYLGDFDTDSEPGSADLATIVTVERKASSGVTSRAQLVEKTFLVSEDPVSTSRSIPVRLGPSARRPVDIPAWQPLTSDLTPPLVLPRAPSVRPSTPAGRVMGLPPRPKLDVKPLGNQQMTGTAV